MSRAARLLAVFKSEETRIVPQSTLTDLSLERSNTILAKMVRSELKRILTAQHSGTRMTGAEFDERIASREAENLALKRDARDHAYH